jgi:hypothetical protein
MQSLPHLVVGIESAAFHFFEAAAAELRQLQPGQDPSAIVSHCVCLCRYAFSVSKPRLVTHLLVDAAASASAASRSLNQTAPSAFSTVPKLARSSVCFIGSAYDKQEGTDLDAVSEGLQANFVSHIYLTALDASMKSIATFLSAAGAQSGL